MIKKNNNILLFFLKIFIPLYIISLNFHQFDILELDAKIQLKITELIFVFLLIFFFLNLKVIKINNFNLFDYIILIFPIISILQLAFFQNKLSLVGLLSSIYLFLIYFVFKTLMHNGYKKIIFNYIIFSGAIASFFAILGWLFIQFEIKTNLILVYEYPFRIGQSGRSTSFFETPNSLFLFLILPFFFSLYNFIKELNIKNSIIFIFIAFALMLTFSKSIIIILGLIPYFIFYKVKNKITIYSKIFLIFLSIIYLVISNVIILDKSSNLYNQMFNKTYVNPERGILYENSEILITRTNYYEAKVKSLELIKASPFIGKGFNSFANYKNEKYPNLIGRPHSTYFGMFAENGILGFIFVILLFYYSYRKTLFKNNMSIPFNIICIFLIIDGFNTDLLYTKIFWIFFALIDYNSNKKLNSEKN